MRRTLGALAAAALAAACGPVDTSGNGAISAADGGAGSPMGGAPGGGNAVTISIVEPRDGDECEIDEHHGGGCKVTVSVTGAVLAAPGACGGSRGSCGHVDFYIDGTACGSPNTQASTRSFEAQPGKCPSVQGQHVFSCELRNDRGERLAASQTVTVRVKLED